MSEARTVPEMPAHMLDFWRAFQARGEQQTLTHRKEFISSVLAENGPPTVLPADNLVLVPDQPGGNHTGYWILPFPFADTRMRTQIEKCYDGATREVRGVPQYDIVRVAWIKASTLEGGEAQGDLSKVMTFTIDQGELRVRETT